MSTVQPVFISTHLPQITLLKSKSLCIIMSVKESNDAGQKSRKLTSKQCQNAENSTVDVISD